MLCDICVRDLGLFTIFMIPTKVEGLPGQPFGCEVHERIFHPFLGYKQRSESDRGYPQNMKLCPSSCGPMPIVSATPEWTTYKCVACGHQELVSL